MPGCQMVNRRGLEVEIVTLLALRYVTVKGDDGPILQGMPVVSRVGTRPLAYLDGCTWEM